MSENRDKLQEQIKLQGDLVRKVKAAKEPKEKVSYFNADEIILNETWGIMLTSNINV